MSRIPTCSNYLHGKSLTDKVKTDLTLEDFVLRGNFNIWSLAYFIDTYFLLESVHDITGHNLYQKISNALTELVDNESRSRTLRRYLRKVYNYFTSKDAKLEFLLKYKDVEREKRFEHASEALNEEANITSIELVGNRLAENSRKRNFEVSFIKIIIPVYV